MRILTVLVTTTAISAVCSAARADLVNPRLPVGFVAIQSAGDITIGNSWTVPVTLLNVGNDLLVVEAVGADFEPGGISVTGPADWTGTRQSAGVGYVAGSVVTSPLDVSLTFEDPLPQAAGDLSVIFSAFLPGSDTAYAVAGMTWDGMGGFTYPVPVTITSLTRSSLAAAPVPGALFLGVFGLGFVGLLRKRLC